MARMARSSTGQRKGAGVASAAVALGVVQLTAAFFSPASDARTAVGTAVINLTPGPVKEWAILTFGTAVKLFLSVSVIAVPGLGPARQVWHTVTLRMVLVESRWLVDDWKSVSGPTPSPSADASFEDATVVAGPLGWSPVGVG